MRTRSAATLTLLLCIAMVALVLAGCSNGTSSMSSGSGTTSMSGSAKGAGTMENSASSSSSGSMAMSDMQCALCANKGNVPNVSGTVKDVDGVQVVEIGIKDNAYNPNTFTAKAGVPIKVVVTGKASDCLAKPTFPKLNKSVDIGQTGSGTIELGALAAGTYELTCGMSSHGGQIIVQ